MGIKLPIVFTMKQKLALLLICTLLLLTPVMAQNTNYTETFPSTNQAIINQSIVQDPTNGNSIPWDIWLASGLIGFGLVILALCKPRIEKNDYETDIVLSVLAWPFCWFFTWGCLTSVDKIVGVGITSVNGVAVMVTQHVLYSFWLEGWICVGGDIIAAFVTALLVSQFNLFKERQKAFEVERQKQKQEEE